jgi:PAS domain S-box-containing protein
MEHFFTQHPEVLDRLHDAVIATDKEGTITTCNLSAVSLFGYPNDELVGLNIGKLYSPEQLPAMQHMLERVQVHRSADGEFINCTRDGREIWVHLSASLLETEPGLPYGMIIFASDITDRKRVEDELVQTKERAMLELRKVERQAAAARMGSALAHEINNPLASLTNVLYLFRRSEFGLQHPDLALAAEESLERVTRITRQMIGLSSESEALSDVNIAEIIDDTIAAYQSTVRAKGLILQKQIELHQEKFFGVESDLRRLIASLIENAVEHTLPQGTLRIRVYPSGEWTANKRAGIRIVILDSGPGIPREKLPEIFDAFYSTKAKKGSGLGLWASRSIAEKHGGAVKVRSSTRNGFSGTCVSVFLPAFNARKNSLAAKAS